MLDDKGFIMQFALLAENSHPVDGRSRVPSLFSLNYKYVPIPVDPDTQIIVLETIRWPIQIPALGTEP